MADFFEKVDGVGIVERHTKQVLALEDEKARKLLKRYKEVRQELRDRLDTMPGDKFSAQQLRGVLTQVEAAIEAMQVALLTGMRDVALESAMMGVEHQLEEIRVFDREFTGAVAPINIDVQLVASDSNNFLLNRYESSLDAYGQDLINSLTTTLSTEALAQSSFSSVVHRLGRFFQGEEWKLFRIARTELHNVYNIAKMNGMREVRDEVLPDMMKTLIHPMDSRTGEDSKILARRNPIIPIDQPFKYTFKGKTRIFMAPPDRPNDRAILVPYRQAWD
jgi:hypothetical protein